MGGFQVNGQIVVKRDKSLVHIYSQQPYSKGIESVFIELLIPNKPFFCSILYLLTELYDRPLWESEYTICIVGKGGHTPLPLF